MTESGVMARTCMAFGQMNEPPGFPYARGIDRPDAGRGAAPTRRIRTCCCSSTTSTASFRRAARFQALLGRIPAAVGYQPTLANELGALQERITSTKNGSITSVQAIYVPADDLTDPAPATTFLAP